jgi:hypothetical protein
MSQRMPRSSHSHNAGLPAHDLKISSRVPHRQGRTAPRGKQSRVLVLSEVPVQSLAQLNAHWYESLFVALAVNQKNEVVEVHILARQAQQLAYPHAGVQRDHGDSVSTGLITADGLPVYKPVDMLRVKRR